MSRRGFNFYLSFYETADDLTNAQLGELMRYICDVEFLRVHIDSVDPKDKIVRLIWKTIRESIRQQVKGYSDKTRTPYDDNFTPLAKGCDNLSVTPCQHGDGDGHGNGHGNGDGDVHENGELPKGVEKKVWEDFEQHRKEIRKPLTKLSRTKNQNILLANLSDQREIVDTTIQNRWTGLFPLKKTQTPKNSQTGTNNTIDQYFNEKQEVIDVGVN